LVRLRLRPRRPRRHHSQLHIQHDVTTTVTGRTTGCAEPTQRLPRLITILIYFDNRPQHFCLRLLPSTISIRQFARRCPPTRQLPRLLPGQHGDRMVHILELSHVLCRGPASEYAILGRVSISAVLRWLWHHGDLQQ
jgi:hypothetical protein